MSYYTNILEKAAPAPAILGALYSLYQLYALSLCALSVGLYDLHAPLWFLTVL